MQRRKFLRTMFKCISKLGHESVLLSFHLSHTRNNLKSFLMICSLLGATQYQEPIEKPNKVVKICDLLQILTESEIDVKGKERVQSILEEQKKTLRTLMSKPQVDFFTDFFH